MIKSYSDQVQNFEFDDQVTAVPYCALLTLDAPRNTFRRNLPEVQQVLVVSDLFKSDQEVGPLHFPRHDEVRTGEHRCECSLQTNKSLDKHCLLMLKEKASKQFGRWPTAS